MTATVERTTRRPISSTTLVLLAIVLAAWIATIAWIRADDMAAMPGTMGMSVAAFTVMWGLMMTAMMLPSVSPFVRTYQATVTTRRAPRLVLLGCGYVVVWTAVGLVAYVVADRFGRLASDRPNVAHAVAVVTFAVVGIYQLTPLKFRCLSHCRSPLGHLMHSLGFRGPLRDLKAGAHHGYFCLGCCWALMLLMITFGVMNVAAMVGLAAVITIEKMWRHGERFARAVGVACLVFAVVLVFEPGLAPGLDPDSVMQPMSM